MHALAVASEEKDFELFALASVMALNVGVETLPLAVGLCYAEMLIVLFFDEAEI